MSPSRRIHQRPTDGAVVYYLESVVANSKEDDGRHEEAKDEDAVFTRLLEAHPSEARILWRWESPGTGVALHLLAYVAVT